MSDVNARALEQVSGQIDRGGSCFLPIYGPYRRQPSKAKKLSLNINAKPGLASCWRSKLPITLLSLLIVLSSGIAVATNSPDDRHIRNRIYVGGGAGVAMLSSPVHSQTNNIPETSGLATVATLGVDISKHWSAEIYHAELGKTSVVDKASQQEQGDVRYRNYGASLLGYVGNRYQPTSGRPNSVYKDEGYYLREGLSAFGRLGISRSTYSTAAEVDLPEEEGVHVGGGIEYGWDNGTSARAELVRYDEHAWAAVAGFMTRFGPADPYLADPQTMFEPSRQDDYQTRLVKLAQLSKAKRKPQAQNTKRPRPDASPVLIFLPIVHFDGDSATLSEEAKDQLRILADTLVRYPYLQLVMEGYTDSHASEDSNLLLSMKRAASVKAFLIDNNIGALRLKTAAMSTRSPTSASATSKGRAQSRRVEFSVYTKKDQA